MKNRPRVLIFMEILRALREGPLIPTRLSQLCNVNYERMAEFLNHLEGRGLVQKMKLDDHDAYAITNDGFKVLDDWARVWAKLAIE